MQLARGDLASALAFAKGGAERQAHVLRLVAASDGAGAGQIAEALALPPERGQDASTAWLTLALAVKAGQETPARRALAQSAGQRFGAQMMAFFDSVKKGADPAVSERLLDGVEMEYRANAYSAALVLSGQRAY
ncbi:hypothetical protein LP420_18080 [Massilia sp. B-10]|nr:hypothetical protein LP420_18080 [Massilia sp. B-10]